jgi:hypothetical protein
VELAQGISILPDEREQALAGMRGEVVASDWRDDPRVAAQAADPANGVEASNAAGSFEAFASMFGGIPAAPPEEG